MQYKYLFCLLNPHKPKRFYVLDLISSPTVQENIKDIVKRAVYHEKGSSNLSHTVRSPRRSCLITNLFHLIQLLLIHQMWKQQHEVCLACNEYRQFKTLYHPQLKKLGIVQFNKVWLILDLILWQKASIYISIYYIIKGVLKEATTFTERV